MLVGRRAQFGARLSGEGGQECGVEVDRMQLPVPVYDDVRGLQVAVGAVVGDHAGGQGVERFRKAPELRRIAREGGFGDRFVEGRTVDPVAQNRIDPDACFRRSVEVELLFEHSVAVDLPQVAHPAQVAAQRPDASVAADAEDDGRIADAVKGASLPVPAQLHLAQRACQAVGIGECEQVLAKGEHVVRWVLSVVRSVGDGAKCEKVR